MKTLTNLTKSQVKTAQPILEDTKALLIALRSEGVDFEVGKPVKETITDHAYLPDHVSIKLVISKGDQKYRILDLRITGRGKLLSNPENCKSHFTGLDDLKALLN